jgi:hypothetical protein
MNSKELSAMEVWALAMDFSPAAPCRGSTPAPEETPGALPGATPPAATPIEVPGRSQIALALEAGVMDSIGINSEEHA